MHTQKIGMVASRPGKPYSGKSVFTRKVRNQIMDKLNLRCIRGTDPDAVRQLAGLRPQLSAQGAVVSPRVRQLTQTVFGEALTPVQVVERICGEVRRRGLPALLD